MIYSNEIWYLVTNTRGVTGFVGPQGRPLPLTDEEVARMGRMAIDTLSNNDKNVLVVQGGPGTGKSVLAINLLKYYISMMGLNASYVTKNSAPREAYLKLLSKSDLKKEVNIKQLFRSPFGLCHSPTNYYDCLIVDEAVLLIKSPTEIQ